MTPAAQEITVVSYTTKPSVVQTFQRAQAQTTMSRTQMKSFNVLLLKKLLFVLLKAL